MNLAQLALLQPLLGKKVVELTDGDILNAAKAFGIEVNLTDELRQAALGLLQGRGIDQVSDLIQSPESLQQLTSLLKGNALRAEPISDQRLVQCTHCEEFFLIKQ